MKRLRILNTRPLGQNHALSQAIVQAGGEVIELPVITIEPTSLDWLKTLPTLSTVQHALFTSRNAVHHFFNALNTHAIHWPTSIQTIAIGQACATALKQYNITTPLLPNVADSEHLLAMNALQSVPQHTILLIKGEGGRTLIEETLQKRNAIIIPLAVYRRTMPTIAPSQLKALWQFDAVDMILFTSEQAIKQTFTLFGNKAHAWLCEKPSLVISERLAHSAKCAGIKNILVTRYDSIVHTIQGLIHDHQHR